MVERTSPFWLFTVVAYISSYFTGDNNDIDRAPIDTDPLKLEYDFVIVGGGSAGCVLASRLSEDPNVTVALLEAGGQETKISMIPGLVGYLQLSDMDWQYKTEPSSTSCLAMVEHRCNFPRGKVIGGSSSINYMLYVRGNRRDYDHWERLGNRDWGYDKILPFFRLSEDNQNPSLIEDKEYHRSGGYLTISEASWRTRLSSAFIDAAYELGYPIGDCNSYQQTGFMIPQGFIRGGYRCSNARAFLRPARNRPNLHVALYTFATKVLIHSGMKRAYGVTYDRHDGTDLKVLARKEVILSGGALGSPHLLMLSGIGPARHLAQFNISVIQDLPVGRNLQDHVASGPIFTITEPVSLITNLISTFPALVQYATLGTGPLTTFGGVEGLGFVSTDNSTDDWPDIEYHFLSGSHGSDDGDFFYKTLGLKRVYWDDFYRHLHKVHHFTLITKLLRPLSRGFLQLRSTNPYDYPEIIPNYFSREEDMYVLIEGIKKAVELGQTETFKRFGAQLFEHHLPGCTDYALNTEEYWECYSRHLTLTIYHYSGTAKMGPYWDPESVVDPQLRVYGVGGLRVVDASIFPTIPSGNTNAPVTMVAEKAAHMIKQYYESALSNPSPLIPVKRVFNNKGSDEL
ncbi:glucose dehydrogenase [FAD, quinone]-like isoform X1 [Macrobrachium rosenbergii]|uniref:glucose dehydrogenase [FAD, quinone]-like isoform X1 n=2 Tax=Macrobrachium rosenbergii TaxID=79674 RepID=UPI0034D6D9BC